MSDELVIETKNLTKKFSNGVVAVDGLDLRVRRGEIFGFLGRNGAGKTTTMRMLVGLVHPTAGTAHVLGHVPGTPHQLQRVGALIETPAFYPHLSGLDNLLLAARYAGVPATTVHRVLDEVGLADRMRSPFRTYSLGMKQRLGVAAALLKDPELLILDEPTNGLDPAGVADMRELVRAVGRGGRTVLLSSHVLGEVEQICDRVGVIDGGRLVAEGTPSQLRESTNTAGVIVVGRPLETAANCLREHPAVREVRVDGDQLRVAVDPTHTPDLTRKLVEAGVDVCELRPFQRSLEDAFLELTSHPNTPAEAPESTLESAR